MRFFRHIAILLLAGLQACSSGNSFKGRFRTVERVEPIKVECERLKCEADGAVTGFVADSLYIFYTPMHPDYHLAIGRCEDMTSIARIAHVGRGPNEFTMISPSDRAIRDDNGVYIWLHDLDRGQMVKVNLSESCRKGQISIDSTISLKEHQDSQLEILKGSMVEFSPINDSLAVVQTYQQGVGQNRLLYNYRTHSVAYDYTPLFERVERVDLNGMGIYVKPSGDKVLMNPAVFNQLNICDIDGENSFSISYRKTPLTVAELSVLSGEELMQKMVSESSICGVAMTDNAIVVNYLDRRAGKSELHIFDWEGELKHILQPDCVMRNISIDDEGRIYGFVNDELVARLDASQYLN